MKHKLVEYSDSEEENTDTVPKKRYAKLPPSFIANINVHKTAQDGKIRNKPHIRGQWATAVFIKGNC